MPNLALKTNDRFVYFLNIAIGHTRNTTSYEIELFFGAVVDWAEPVLMSRRTRSYGFIRLEW
jgi:hypothetical protein